MTEDQEKAFLDEVVRRARSDPGFADAVKGLADGRPFVVMSGATFVDCSRFRPGEPKDQPGASISDYGAWFARIKFVEQPSVPAPVLINNGVAYLRADLNRADVR